MRIRTPLLSECIMDAWLGKHIEKQRYRETQALAAATADDLATIKMRGKRKALPAAVSVDALIAIPAYLRALRAFTSIATSVTTILHVLIALSRQLRPSLCLPATKHRHSTTSKPIYFHTAPGSLVLTLTTAFDPQPLPHFDNELHPHQKR